MKYWKQVFAFSVVAIFLVSMASASAQDDTQVDFVNQIKPILESHCLKCHVGEDAESVDLTISDDAMDYIEAEDAEGSPFYEYLITDDEDELMPPADENNPLSVEQIQLIKNWIDQGANWPQDVSFVIPQDEPAVDETNANQDPTKKPPAAEKIDNTLFNAIGSLHPAAVHLPIGLFLAAGLFALFGIRGNFVMSDCAYYCLWLGVLGAIVACVSGWWFSPMENRGTVTEFADLIDQNQDIFWHRTSGLIATGFALVLALFAASARAKDPDDGVLWKVGLIVLACGIAYVGHEGGQLTHGRNHYKDLNNLINQFAPGIFGEPVQENADDSDDDNETVDSNIENNSDDETEDADVGQSSNESKDLNVKNP